MAKIKGQLEDAQAHNKATDPTNLPEGLTWLNTTSSLLKTVIGGIKQVFVFEDAAQTLSNKSIDGDTNTFSNVPVPALKADLSGANGVLRRDATGVVISDKQAPAGNFVGTTDTQTLTNKTLTSALTSPGNAVVGTGEVQTLTNKTLTAPVINSPTGLVKADIAGIDQVDNVSDANKPVSAATQTALDLKANIASPTFTGTVSGVTAAMVGLDQVNNTSDATKNAAVAVLTNKDIDGGTASNASRITLPKAAKATLDSLTRKAGTIVFDTDSGKPYFDDGAALQLVGSGSGGAKNYIANGDAEGGSIHSIITAWTTAASRPNINNFNGQYANTIHLALSTTSTAPQSGTKSYLLTKAAANAQGHYFQTNFTIDAKDKAKVLEVSFDYIVNSGTFQAGSSTQDSDLIAYIYDRTSATFIEPSNIKLTSNSTTLSSKFSATFQSLSNSVDYAIFFWVATTNTAAWALKLDNILVSPSVYVYGTPVTDITPFTGTFGSGFGTVINNVKMKRLGDCLILSGTFDVGTITSAAPIINLPYSVNTASFNSTAFKQSFGRAWRHTATGSSAYLTSGSSLDLEYALTYNGTANQIQMVRATGSTTSGGTFVNEPTSNMMGSGQTIVLENIVIPIQGFSSSVQMSDSADTRVVAASVHTATLSSTFDLGSRLVTFGAATTDTHSGWNGTTTYTCQVPGIYDARTSICYYSSGSPANVRLHIYKNGASVAQNLTNIATNVFCTLKVDGLIELKSGDTLQVYQVAPSNASFQAESSLNYFEVKRLSGPSAIAANESVSALYTGAPTGTIQNNFNNIMTFPGRVKDSHSAYAGGVYTVPSSGTYSVSVMTLIDGTYSLNSNMGISLFVDGAESYTKYIISGGAMTALGDTLAVHSIPLRAGQALSVRIGTSATSPVYSGTSQRHQFSIVRTGNY